MNNSHIDPLVSLLRNMWQKRLSIIYFNGSIAIIALIYLLFIAKPYYESNITILPDYGASGAPVGGGSLAELSSIASMAGINVGEGSSTEIYRNLLYSETILEPVFNAKYATLKNKDSLTLYDILGITEDLSLQEYERNREKFVRLNEMFTLRMMSTTLDPMTKILNIKLVMPDSHLASAVINKLALSLDEYVKTKRKSNAMMRCAYIERRIDQVKDSLMTAEERLKVFRSLNNVLAKSSSLMLEESRLVRNMEIFQVVYIELTKQLEIARIDVVKDTPVINIREFAQPPVVKAGPRRTVNFILIMSFSFISTVLYSMFSATIWSFILRLKIEILRV